MSEPDSPPPRRNRFTFGLAAMMLLMLMCSILSALLAGMMRHGDGDQYAYVLVSVAAPVGVMIAISLWAQARKTRKRRRPPELEE